MALTDKLTAIANAIRGKTDKAEKLTLPQIVEEINTNWHAYVKNFSLTGTFNDINTSFGNNGFVYGYTPDGKLIIIAKSKNSSYELIYWRLGSHPDSVVMEAGREPNNWEASGEPEQLCACVLSGITQNCKVTIEQTDTSSTYDYVEITVNITYI